MGTVEFDLARMDGGFIDCGWLAHYDLAERNAYIRECRLFLFSKLGAVVIDGCLKYWRVLSYMSLSTHRCLRAFLIRRLARCRGLHRTLKLNSGRWY